ncbi:hypothetical protein G746_00965 [Escherichia coli HVH 84 (4-1021478)]|nr:hypothetical protein G746_00965 [Escherichia coli HVH 84 (4-1021478)]EQU60358.1 hypothetical protein G857_00021 [Escherichia coli HVH 205 (4-3094677)]
MAFRMSAEAQTIRVFNLLDGTNVRIFMKGDHSITSIEIG